MGAAWRAAGTRRGEPAVSTFFSSSSSFSPPAGRPPTSARLRGRPPAARTPRWSSPGGCLEGVPAGRGPRSRAGSRRSGALQGSRPFLLSLQAGAAPHLPGLAAGVLGRRLEGPTEPLQEAREPGAPPGHLGREVPRGPARRRVCCFPKGDIVTRKGRMGRRRRRAGGRRCGAQQPHTRRLGSKAAAAQGAEKPAISRTCAPRLGLHHCCCLVPSLRVQAAAAAAPEPGNIQEGGGSDWVATGVPASNRLGLPEPAPGFLKGQQLGRGP